MQKIRIDFDNPGLPQHISAVENDSQSRFFQATLYENGKAYTAPEGATYSIMYRGFGPQNQGWYDTINDGAGKRAACKASGNVVTCEIARQALQVPGHVSIVLCVTTGKGYIIKSWPIECDCKNDRYDSTAEIQSFFYITQVSNADWTQAIQAAEELKNAIDPTLSVEGKAADAKATGDAVGELKEDLANETHLLLTAGKYKLGIVENEYIKKQDGSFVKYDGWARTSFLPCEGLERITIKNWKTANNYNGFYDSNKSFIDIFDIPASLSTNINIPDGACYFALSNTSHDINNISVYANIPFFNDDDVERINKYDNARNECVVRFYNYDVSIGDFNTILFNGRITIYKGKGPSKDFTFDIVKQLFPSDVVGDHIKIDDWNMICFNIETETLEKVSYNDIKKYHIVLIANVNGVLCKCLLNDWVETKYNSSDGIGYITKNYKEPNNRLFLNQDANTASIVMITDSHHTLVDDQLPVVKSIKNVIEESAIDAVVCGGDCINDHATIRDDSIQLLKDYHDELYKLNSPILPCVGNHDDLTWFQSNYNTAKLPDLRDFYISPKEMYKCMSMRSNNYVVRDTGNPYGNYFYYDIPNKNFRVLCLNTSDLPTNIYVTKNVGGINTIVQKYDGAGGAFQNEQVQFVKNMLENYNDNLIVFSHIPLVHDSGIIGHDGALINEGAIIGLLKAWKNGTDITFTGSNADIPCSVSASFSGSHNLVGCFAGHTHYDNIAEVDGITHVTTLNGQCGSWNPSGGGTSPPRTNNTISKVAFDVITVNKENRTVKLTRFGAGSDREFTY